MVPTWKAQRTHDQLVHAGWEGAVLLILLHLLT